MKTKMYAFPLLLMGVLCYSQDKIIKKNGNSFEAKIIEVGASNITYKELDYQDGPTHSLNKPEIYKIIYGNGKEDLLGKYHNVDEVKAFIADKIREFGADRDNGMLRLAAEFEGNNIRINSVDKNGKLYYKGDLWDLSKVVEFHKVSKRKNGDAFLNIVTYKVKRSSEKLDKLVIRVMNYGIAEELSEAFKDLNIMLKKS
ncbi:hypothetical protein BBI01_07475 [Chryseobacterium artocarpi]|uniref:Uncharacterized protein n=1 Tax=Chryseobacterium artocarpi TaxID=1414727 RepID=A0A1B8ZK70_9FLAO|nr:hypothetical protein [Chryseobacterium artocarpi]OCA71988.1 hypothetical protein BBI01_07475 [Chryseobacterium artocarpi]